MSDQLCDVCCVCVAMGDRDLNVTQVAQQSFLFDCSSVSVGRWISYGSSPPTGDQWDGVYVDDAVALGIVTRGASAVAGDVPSAVQTDVASSRFAYAKAGTKSRRVRR